MKTNIKQKEKPSDKHFEKWIEKTVGIQDASFFSKGSMVRDVAIMYARYFEKK